MGGGLSRGKKVAPARVGERHASDASFSPREELSSGVGPGSTADATRRAHLETRGGGRDTGGGGAAGAAATGCRGAAGGGGDLAGAKNGSAGKTPARSRTYGLCRFKRADSDNEESAQDSAVVFSHLVGKHAPRRSPDTRHRVLLQGDSTVEPVPNTVTDPESSRGGQSTTAAMPINLYDGSEEELMETIVREFI